MENNLDVYQHPKKELNKLVMPILITSIIGSLNTLVDTSFIGHLGGNALSASGLITPLYILIISFGSSVGVGTNVLMSRFIGNNDTEHANKIFNNSIFITIIIGIILTIIIVIFNRQVLGLFGVSNQVYEFAADYSVIFYGCIILLVQGIFSSIFNAELRSKLTAYCNILTIITNVLFDFIFMYIFGWGMFGIGLGTLLSSVFVVILMIFLLYYLDDWIVDYKIDFKLFSLNNLVELFKIGIPSFLESNVSTIFNIILNYLLLAIGGSIAVGIYSGSWRFIQLGFILMGAYGASLTTVCSMFYGRNDLKTIKELYFYALRNTFIIGIVMFILFNIIGKYLALIITQDASLISGITQTLSILSLFFIIMPFSTMSGSIFNSIDKPRVSLIVTLLKYLVFELIFMFLFTYLGFGVNGIYYGMILGVFLGGILGSILIYKYFKDLIDLNKLRVDKELIKERSELIREDYFVNRHKSREELIEKIRNNRNERYDTIKSKREKIHNNIKDRHYFTLAENRYKFR